jgi:hypothetical protein
MIIKDLGYSKSFFIVLKFLNLRSVQVSDPETSFEILFFSPGSEFALSSPP